jgi:hypothetical protein
MTVLLLYYVAMLCTVCRVGLAWLGFGLVWHFLWVMVWYGMVWCGMVWCGTGSGGYPTVRDTAAAQRRSAMYLDASIRRCLDTTVKEQTASSPEILPRPPDV